MRLLRFLLGLVLGAFSHCVRSPATLRPPFREIMCERALEWGGSGEERSEELALLAVQVCPAQVLTCKLRPQDDMFQLLSHCNLKGHSEQEAPSPFDAQIHEQNKFFVHEQKKFFVLSHSFDWFISRWVEHSLLLQLTFLPVFFFYIK